MGKLRHGEVKQYAPGHRAQEGRQLGLKPAGSEGHCLAAQHKGTEAQETLLSPTLLQGLPSRLLSTYIPTAHRVGTVDTVSELTFVKGHFLGDFQLF